MNEEQHITLEQEIIQQYGPIGAETPIDYEPPKFSPVVSAKMHASVFK
jgi:hypothetical protein